MERGIIRNSKEIYSRPSDGCFYSPFNTSLDKMDQLILINFEKDPDELYNVFEFQEAIDDYGHRRYLVIAYCIDGKVDIYHQLSYPIASQANVLNEATFFERPLADAKFAVSTDYLVVNFSFEDKKGRQIAVEVKEKNRLRKHPFFMLAPVGVQSKNPISLPVYSLYEMEFANKKNTIIDIDIDGVKHKPDTFPLPIDWASNYFTRYSTNTFNVDFNKDVNGPLNPLVPDKKLNAEDSDTMYDLFDNDGHYEISCMHTENYKHKFSICFNPYIPDLACLMDDAEINGRFRIGTDYSTGRIYGDYFIIRSGNTVKISLEPGGGWKPKEKRWMLRLIYRLVKVFKQWPTTYLWNATITFDDPNQPVIQSKWERI